MCALWVQSLRSIYKVHLLFLLAWKIIGLTDSFEVTFPIFWWQQSFAFISDSTLQDNAECVVISRQIWYHKEILNAWTGFPKWKNFSLCSQITCKPIDWYDKKFSEVFQSEHHSEPGLVRKSVLNISHVSYIFINYEKNSDRYMFLFLSGWRTSRGTHKVLYSHSNRARLSLKMNIRIKGYSRSTVHLLDISRIFPFWLFLYAILCTASSSSHSFFACDYFLYCLNFIARPNKILISIEFSVRSD